MGRVFHFVTASIFACLALSYTPPSQAAGFGFQDVVEKARNLAGRPYQAPAEIPRALRDLRYDEFRTIRFDPEKSLWRDQGAPFQVMLIAPGGYFRHSVRLNQVDAEGVNPIPFRKDAFTFGSPEIADKVPDELGFAGFTLTYPLNQEGVQDQFLSFAGASYFRGVGAGNAFGISARGAVVDTGLMTGEEFPNFVEYWLVRPAPGARRMHVFALLDSKRLTGAYRFTITPGQPTEVAVETALFTRERIELLGAAPLTSMYFYGENTARPRGNWRPEVHDSDGLLIHDGTGEWIWRPVLNPRALQTYSFLVQNVNGFGLLQRDEAFDSYQDPEAHYERRPSAWVEFEPGLDKGRIMLVEIPTNDETNDNIVAFWSPPGPVEAKQRVDVRYRLSFGEAQALPLADIARVANTFVGRGDVIGGGNVENSYRILVDFAGGALPEPGAEHVPEATITAAKGELVDYHVQFVEAARVWRLSMLVRPAQEAGVSLRAALRSGEQTLTETWDYHLPVENSIREGQQ